MSLSAVFLGALLLPQAARAARVTITMQGTVTTGTNGYYVGTGKIFGNYWRPYVFYVAGKGGFLRSEGHLPLHPDSAWLR